MMSSAMNKIATVVVNCDVITDRYSITDLAFVLCGRVAISIVYSQGKILPWLKIKPWWINTVTS